MDDAAARERLRYLQLKAKAAAASPSVPAGVPQVEAPSDILGDAGAAVQGIGAGASLNYMPQLQALAEPAITKVMDLATGQNQYADLPDYATRRDQWIKHQQKVAEEHPKSFMGGNLLGTLATGMAAPAGAFAEGAGLGTKAAAMIASGAAARAIQNPGDKEGVVDPLQLSERAHNAVAAKSGLDVPFTDIPIPAAAIDAALPLAGPALGYAADKTMNGAKTLAFKALGPYARQARQAFGRGKVKDIGGQALEVMGPVPKSYAGLEDALAARNASLGKELGDTVESMAAKETGIPVGVSREAIAGQLEKDLINPGAADAAGVADKNAQIKQYIEQFRRGDLPAGAEGPINDKLSLLEAELKKRNVANTVKWDRLPGADIPVSEEFNRALVTKLKTGVEQGGEQLAEKTGFPVDKFKKLKEDYGNTSAAESIVKNRKERNFANNIVSPSSYGTGALGAIIGGSIGGSPEERLKHAVMGAGLGLVNAGAKTYGNQIMANTLRNASGTMSLGARLANQASQNPLQTQLIWQSLYNQNKEQK